MFIFLLLTTKFDYWTATAFVVFCVMTLNQLTTIAMVVSIMMAFPFWARISAVYERTSLWFNKMAKWMFFLKPMALGRNQAITYNQLQKHYHWINIGLTIFYRIPWRITIVWYFIVVRGCQTTLMRGFLEDVCTAPFFERENILPWYLDLWDPFRYDNQSIVHDNEPVQKILTGHAQLLDTSKALRHQASKLKKSGLSSSKNQIISKAGRSRARRVSSTLSTDILPLSSST